MERATMRRRLQRSVILLSSAVALAMPLAPAWAQQAAAPGSPTPVAQSQPGTPGDGGATQPVPPPAGVGSVEVRIPGTRPAATKFSFNFKDAPIDAVLNHISAQAGFTVIKYTPIEGRVTVVSQQDVSADQAVSLLNTVLAVSGYTAVQQGKTLKIMTRDSAKTANIPVHFGADPEKIPPTDDIVTQVIPIKTVDAAKLKQNLQSQVSSNATFTADAGSNTLQLTDTQASIRRIVEIVSALDKKDPASSGILTRQLKNADAQSAVKLITDIFKTDEQQGANSNLPPQVQFMRRAFGRGGFGRGGFGGGGGAPGGAPGAGDTAEGGERQAKIVASADTRTNTIVVTGPQETLDLINKEILDKLDADPMTTQTFFIYPLKNAQAANLQGVLNSLFGSSNVGGARTTTNNNSNRLSSGSQSRSGFGSTGGGGFGGGGFGGGGGGFGGGGFGGGRGGGGFGGGGFGGNTGGFGGGGFNRGGFGGGFGGGGSSNAAGSTAAELQGQVYVVADTDTNSLLVATASKYQDQVRAVIAELDRPIPQVLIKVLIAEVTHENTDDLSFDFSFMDQRAGTTKLQNGHTVNNGVTGGSSFVPTANQTGGLTVSLVENNFQATLQALQVNNKLDVLSRPYILATDNQLAEIVVGSEVPFVTDSNVTSLGTIVNTVQYRQIGIILDVTPHINPDGLVIMDVQPEISSQTSQFVQVTNGVNAQVYNIRSASTRVGVKDGNTVVIGGLMEDRKIANLQKVPILGDIPLVGLLFQNNHVDKSKTELLIFMTPHVAQMPDLLKPMSADEVKGLKTTPGAVNPGVFDEHIRGLQRGGAPNNPGNLIPSNPAQPRMPATQPAGGQ
jgi:general secretion pathway protein D